MTLSTKLKILNWVAVFLHFCSACTVLVFLITGRDVVYHLSYTTTTWARCTESFDVAPVLFYGDGFSGYYANMQSQYVKATCDSDAQCIAKQKKEFDQSMQLDIAWAGYQNCDENLTSLVWGPNSATLQCESQIAPKVTNEKTTDAEQIRKLAREKMTTSLYCNSGLWVTQNFSSSDDQELMKLSTKLQSSSQISVSLAGSIGSFFLLSALFQAGWTDSTRYIEYAFSASIMIVLLSLQVSQFHASTLFCQFFLCFGCMICGWIADFLYMKHDDVAVVSVIFARRIPLYWIVHFLGWALLLPAYIVIWGTFSIALQENGENVPSFVLPLIVTESFLFFVFGFVQMLQFSKITSFTEKEENVKLIFILLSLSSKFLLGWVIVSQVLFR